MPGNSIQCRRSRMPGSMLFGTFYFFPIVPHLSDTIYFEAAKHMRVAADQLFGNVPRYRVESESATFTCQLTVENNLEQHVAQFLNHFLVISSLNGIDEFI